MGRKKILLTEKEYANICLNCKEPKCIITFQGCPHINPYKCPKGDYRTESKIDETRFD